MRKFISMLALIGVSLISQAQKETPKDLIPAGVNAVVTRNSVTINNKKIDYTAYAGYLDLKNDTGKLIAKVFFTYYKKDGEEANKRPICFTFNGGPGSSSVWLHMGGVGPRRVLLKDDGIAPPPPYQYVNNEYS